jgi:protein SCO1/2
MSTSPERNPGQSGEARRPATFLYAVMGLLVAVLLIGAGGFFWLTGANGGPSIGGPFTLENGSGKTVTDRDFRGKYLLVYFGYTYCPDVCPTTLNAMADALDKLGPKAKDLQPLFITVDPQRDTPDVMKQYTEAFSSALIGLTGTPDQIANVASEYRVYYARHQTGPGPNDYAMDHSSVIYLMGPDGRFIAPIRADESGDEMAAAIGKLVG